MKTRVPGGAPLPMHFLLHHAACRDEGLPRMETQPGDLLSICRQWHPDILGILVSTNIFRGTTNFRLLLLKVTSFSNAHNSEL